MKSLQEINKSIFFHCVSSSMQFPSSTEANPHCGDKAKLSPITSLASKKRSLISSLVSKRGFLY